MEIGVVGITYKEADVDKRGQVAFTTSMKEETTRRLLEAGLQEFMILSTCNRSEIYFATNQMKRDLVLVKEVFLDLGGVALTPYLMVKEYESALVHLYQVATGLDSMILGEDEILGQVKKAWQYAKDQGTSKKYLNKIIREAVTFSKKVRNAYRLSENQLSVASIGVNYLKTLGMDLREKTILMVGTGEMGSLILKYLLLEEVGHVYLTNRTVNREGFTMPAAREVTMIDYEDRYDYISKADIVISATASPHVIFQVDHMPPLMQATFFMDMAVPRDIDPRIESLPYASVKTIDLFLSISDDHLKARHDMAKQIKRLIYEEVSELEAWLLRSKVDHIIKHFHDKQETIIANQKSVLKNLGLDEATEEKIMAMLRTSTWQMIKEPVHQLKEIKEAEEVTRYKLILEDLFLMSEEVD